MKPLLIDVGTYVARDLSIRRWHESEHATIGRYCSVADRVTIFCGGGHRTSLVSTYPFDPKMRGTSNFDSRTYKRSKPTVIGHDVWIASGATITAGVTIGNGAVIGPEAVVFEDVIPYAVMRGNPAERIRRRHSQRIIEALEAIAWWDWPEQTIQERVEDFYGPVDAFVQKYDPR
jgi:acetyltransferase-like isoleucine patch superfamily enzyme